MYNIPSVPGDQRKTAEYISAEGIQQKSGAPVTIESVCNDGLDNDNDSYIDCFDIDCEKECAQYFSQAKVCCLDHNNRTCQYMSEFKDSDCKGYGRYPVVDEATCIDGCRRFQYTYVYS
jgi:hypothetical protein